MARGGEVEWKGTGKGPFLANGADTLRVCRAKDRFTRGIWTAGTPNEDDLLPMEGTLGPSLDQRSPAEKGSERRQQLTPVQCKGAAGGRGPSQSDHDRKLHFVSGQIEHDHEWIAAMGSQLEYHWCSIMVNLA